MHTYREVRSLSGPEAAYLAGLIDGEGTVTLSRKHASDMRQLVVSISNTELPILEFAPEHWSRQTHPQSDEQGESFAERRLFEDTLLALRAGKKEPLQPCG